MKTMSFLAALTIGASIASAQSVESPMFFFFPESAGIGSPSLTPGGAQPVSAQFDTPTIERVDVATFGRRDVPAMEAVALPPLPPALVWDNGPRDDVTGHIAQRTDIGDFLVADDFYVKYGDVAVVDSITFCFAVSDYYDGVMFKPEFGLDLFIDCQGRPDNLFGPILSLTDPELITLTPLGPSVFPGHNLWEVTFDLKPLCAGFAGPLRYWLSPYGIGDVQNGFYYWLSANNGTINGTQAQIKNGAKPWQDVDECDCPGICTDLCFRIEGRICCLQHLSFLPFDTLSGASSLQLFGAQVDTARAADNFQIQPGPPRALCALEAFVATNCPPEKFFIEIYENLCDCPGAKLFTIDVDPCSILNLTQLLSFPQVDGCDVYSLLWTDLGGVVLPPGKTYWISVVGRGTGSILDKAKWLYSDTFFCDGIQITEGKIKDPFVEGLEDFTFVSEATTGLPRDFVFSLYTEPRPVVQSDGDSGSTEDATSGNTRTRPITSVDPRSLGAKLTR